MLRPFTKTDFEKLSSWVCSEELLLQFSATAFPYPLSYADMEVYMSQHPERQFYMISDAGLGDYAFGEIIPQQNDVPRLGRLLVGDPLLRGNGLGKKMISELLDECQSRLGAAGAELYVLIDNQPAIHCYQSLGFKFSGEEIPLDLKGTIKMMRKMRLDF